jgi:cobalt/nickel transport system ATP-binding protein
MTISDSAVSIENLNFSYDGEPVLRNLDLEIRSGETFGILGPSGAGKSTLLLHLNGVLQGRGRVSVSGLDISKTTLPEIRRRVGLVFQNPDDQLFNPTVEEDVAFGPLNMGLERGEVKRRVSDALRGMKLEGFEKRISHRLSFGERKRVALATVLAMEPQVIAFDEPFSNLDPAMVENLVDIIRNLKATVIVVSQQILPALACCDRLAVLMDGRILKTAAPSELAADRDLLQSCGLDFRSVCRVCRDLMPS